MTNEQDALPQTSTAHSQHGLRIYASISNESGAVHISILIPGIVQDLSPERFADSNPLALMLYLELHLRYSIISDCNSSSFSLRSSSSSRISAVVIGWALWSPYFLSRYLALTGNFLANHGFAIIGSLCHHCL